MSGHHINRPGDVELVARRARRSVELLETKGERTWTLTREWAGPLKAAGGDGTSTRGTVSRPTEAAALLDDDHISKLHDRYRAALALAVNALDELDRIITTVTGHGGKAQAHKRNAEQLDGLCLSCHRIGHLEPRRGARWCRWCEDVVRALAAEWTWEPNTAPPLTLVRRHAEGRRVTDRDVREAMRAAGVKRRPEPLEEGASS